MYMNHEGKHGRRLFQIAIVSIAVGSNMLFGAQVYHSQAQFICVRCTPIGLLKQNVYDTVLLRHFIY